jgi:nucleoside-diphosphate-sugar epimerase
MIPRRSTGSSPIRKREEVHGPPSGGSPITLYGTGSQSRSFCYVDDLVTGMIAMMD